MICVNWNRWSGIFFVIGIFGLLGHYAGKASEIINPKKMVCMTVGKKYCVYFADTFAQGLGTEIGANIYKYMFIIFCLNVYRAAQALVAWICRFAYSAVAGDDWNSMAGAGS